MSAVAAMRLTRLHGEPKSTIAREWCYHMVGMPSAVGCLVTYQISVSRAG